MANGGARLARMHMIEPIFARQLLIAANDFNLIAVFQQSAERQFEAVNAHADTAIANLGMHGIGEIQRCCAARHGNQTPFRGEAEHLVIEQFELGVFQKLFRRAAVFQLPDHILQPSKRLDFGRVGIVFRAVLIGPMRGHAAFGNIVHMLGANLHLHTLLIGADNRGVQ